MQASHLEWDYFLNTSAQTAASVPVGNFILLGGSFGQWPGSTTSTLLKVERGQNYPTVPTNYGHGIDLYQGTATSDSFRAAGAVGAWLVDGNGGTQLGPGYIIGTSTGLSLDSPGLVATGTLAVANGGTSYLNNDVIYFGNGGIAHVTSEALGVVNGLAVERYPYIQSGSAPSNPLATTTWPFGNGRGLTLNVTWPSAQNTVTIGSSSTKVAIAAGSVGFYGTTPIAKQSPTGACAGNTGCQALAAYLANLGLIVNNITP